MDTPVTISGGIKPTSLVGKYRLFIPQAVRACINPGRKEQRTLHHRGDAMTLHAGYAASLISSKLKGSTKQFGWLQAYPTTSGFRQFPITLQPCEFVMVALKVLSWLNWGVGPRCLYKWGFGLNTNRRQRPRCHRAVEVGTTNSLYREEIGFS
jgi:hypothetical protein